MSSELISKEVEMLDRNYLFDLANKIADITIQAERASIVLWDIIQEYDFSGNNPMEEQQRKIDYESRRIFDFLNITYDYIISTKIKLRDIENDVNEKWINMPKDDKT